MLIRWSACHRHVHRKIGTAHETYTGTMITEFVLTLAVLKPTNFSLINANHQWNKSCKICFSQNLKLKVPSAVQFSTSSLSKPLFWKRSEVWYDRTFYCSSTRNALENNLWEINVQEITPEGLWFINSVRSTIARNSVQFSLFQHFATTLATVWASCLFGTRCALP